MANYRPTKSWHERLYNLFQDVWASPQKALRIQHSNATQFGELLQAKRTPVLELNSAYGTSLLRDKVTLTGSGAKDDITGTVTSGEIELSTGTTTGSTALLESGATTRYMPGYGSEFGIGMRFPVAPTGDQEIRWGGRTPAGDSGLYWLYDSGGFNVVRQNTGTEDVRSRANWNYDKLDGTGPSGANLDLTKGFIFQINYTWYGYGGIIFSVVGTLESLFQYPIPCHVFTIDDYDGMSINNPSMRIFTEVDNGTTTSDISARVGGRQYSIVGDYNPAYRLTADVRGATALATGVKPLISFRFKTAFRDRSVKLESYNMVNAGNDIAVVEIYMDGSLTGASWGAPTGYTAASTALESDIAATAISGGELIYAGDLIPSSKDGPQTLNDVPLDVPEGSVITLCARSLTGTPSVTSSFRLKEEW